MRVEQRALVASRAIAKGAAAAGAASKALAPETSQPTRPKALAPGDRLKLQAAGPAQPPTAPIAPKQAALWGAVAGFVGAPAALGLLGLMAQPFSLGLSPAVFAAVAGLCGPAFAGLGWCLAKLQGQEAHKRATAAH